MAQKIVRLDDIDSTEGAEPFFFAVNDVHYCLDLSEKNRKKFEDFAATFIEKAVRVDAPKGGRRTPAAQNGFIDADPAKVRAWCAEQGIEANNRGRVPEELTNHYKAAMAEKS